MDIRHEIKLYIDLLRNEAKYSGQAIAEFSQLIKRPFTNSSLAKSYALKSGSSEPKYDMRLGTLKDIADVLRSILRVETLRYPAIANALEKQGISLDISHDYTGIGNDFDDEFVKSLLAKNSPRLEKHDDVISWEVSAQLEKQAKQVDAITTNLNWVMNQIEEIIANLKENKEKTCRYILISNEGYKNKISIENKVRKHPEISRRLDILDLVEDDDKQKKKYSNVDGTVFPCPFDLTIYHSTNYPDSKNQSTIVLANMHPINPVFDWETQKHTSMDRIVNHKDSSYIQDWFNSTWAKYKPE